MTMTEEPRVRVRKSGFCLRPSDMLGAHRFCTTPGCECECHKIPERSGTEEAV